MEGLYFSGCEVRVEGLPIPPPSAIERASAGRANCEAGGETVRGATQGVATERSGDCL